MPLEIYDMVCLLPWFHQSVCLHLFIELRNVCSMAPRFVGYLLADCTGKPRTLTMARDCFVYVITSGFVNLAAKIFNTFIRPNVII